MSFLTTALAKSYDTLAVREVEYFDKGPEGQVWTIRVKPHDTPAYLAAIAELGVRPLAPSERQLDALAEELSADSTAEDRAAEKKAATMKALDGRREIILARFNSDIYPVGYTAEEAAKVAPLVHKHLVDGMTETDIYGTVEKLPAAAVKKAFASKGMIPPVIKRLSDADLDRRAKKEDAKAPESDHVTYMAGHPEGVALTLSVLVAAAQSEEFKKRFVPLSRGSESTEEPKDTGREKAVSINA